MRHISLIFVLGLFWLLLSGFLTTFLLSLGVLTVVVAVLATHRMAAIDQEGHPVQLALRTVTFLPLLICEIVKSAWSVSKIILDPKLPISPTMTTVTAGQKTVVGVNVYGNSITLTPGTVSIAVEDDYITVHAIMDETADGLRTGDMDARVCELMGDPLPKAEGASS